MSLKELALIFLLVKHNKEWTNGMKKKENQYYQHCRVEA